MEDVSRPVRYALLCCDVRTGGSDIGGGGGGGSLRRLKLPNFSFIPAAATIGAFAGGGFCLRLRRQRNMSRAAQKTARMGTTTAAASAPFVRAICGRGGATGSGVFEGTAEVDRLSEATGGHRGRDEVVHG